MYATFGYDSFKGTPPFWWQVRIRRFLRTLITPRPPLPPTSSGRGGEISTPLLLVGRGWGRVFIAISYELSAMS